MRTRLLALLLILAMIAGILASCGGDNGDEGEVPPDPPEKVAFAVWEKAFDLTNATIKVKINDDTKNFWAIDEVVFSADENGAFFETEESFDALSALLSSRAFYDALALADGSRYTAATYIVLGTPATDIEVILSGNVISSFSYKANGVTYTLTATKIGTTDKPSHDRTKTYYWEDNRSIIIEMNLTANNGELSALTKRYMAGVAEEGQILNTRLDLLVSDRNTAAYTVTNTSVDYIFLLDGKYDWNDYHGPISNAIAAPTEDTPDVYCGLAWDLGACSAKGDFINLMSNVRGQGNNYFTFNEDNYNAEYDDEGYFYELMESMSPVDDKMYIYASNYTLDVIRAIYCIPVSITLLESLDLGKIEKTAADFSYKWDSDEDNDFDVDDLYDIVFSNNWTYDMLGILGGAAYSNDSGAAKANFGDTLGFVYDVNTGLQCAGIMFSNDIQLFEKTYNEVGDPVFVVPESNEAFVELVTELSEVFNYSGNFADNVAPAGYESIMYATRARFSEDKILFGGVIMVGALDYTEYQSMEGGFGIVPVPLISAGREYVSAIHNLARVMCIAKTSTKFEEVSAFLDYQALNSTGAMNEYYKILQYDTVGGKEYNIAVLDILRNSLGDNSTHYLENQIQTKPSGVTITIDRWSRMLRTADLDPEALRNKYDESVGNKNLALAQLVAVYQGFEN